MMKNGNETPVSFLHYLPYSEEDKKLGMVCTSAGEIDVLPYTVYPPNKDAHPAAFQSVAEGRTLPEFQLVYISDGAGNFWTEEKACRVSPGSMLLLLPGVKHFYKPLYETGWHEYWVGFNGSFFTHMLKKNIISKKCTLFETGLRDYVRSIFAQIFEEIHTQRPAYQIKTCSLVFSLLAEILSVERRKEQPNHLQKIVEKAKYLMGANINQAIDIPSIAKEIGISVSHLNRVFKTYTSMTPYNYCIQIKINKACRLLQQEDISIKEAAFNLGFEDQYYFSRLFKQKTGIPPSEWRQYIYQ